MSKNFSKALKVVTDEIKNDSSLYQAYQANIAMSFYDEYRRTGNNLSYKEVIKVANRAAIHFLNLLIKE